MVMLVIFIFGAVLLGAGAMLSPAWVTKQPRIGLAGTLALALIIGGSVFWAHTFGWNTLVIDYMLFALVTGIFLGGTLSVGQTRAEQRGEVLLDEDQGWTGPEDLIFFFVVALIFVLPILTLGVPFGQSEVAYYATAVKLGQTLDTLAPFSPDVAYVFPPGFSAITAYMSQQLGQTLQITQAGIGAVVAFMTVWLIYDLGSEVRNKPLGRGMALAILIGFGLFSTFIQANFPALIGNLFMLAMLIYAYRYLQEQYRADLVAAGLLLGAILLVHPGIFLFALAVFVVWLLVLIAIQQQQPLAVYLTLLVAVPVIALIATAPYLVHFMTHFSSQFDALLSETLLAFTVGDLGAAMMYHGLWIVPLAAIGLYHSLKSREVISVWALIALIGGVTLLPWGGSGYLLTLPLAILGGFGVIWLWEQVLLPRVPVLLRRRVYAVMVVIAAVLCWGIIAYALLPTQKPLNEDDLAALDWVVQNAEADAILLNTPDESGLWVPVITERISAFTPHDDLAMIAPCDTTCSLLEVSLTEGSTTREFDYVVLLTNTTWHLPSDAAATLAFESGNARVYRVS